MRLICPNCGAQYEVADDVIPETGRDVQCSNCGTTWFERPGASEAEEHGGLPASEPAPEPEAGPEPDREEAASEPEPEEDPEPEAEPDPEPEPEAHHEDPPEPAKAVERPGLSPEVARILREEAEREEAARQEETVESQPDLGLDAPVDREEQLAEEARRRMARMRGEAAPAIGAAVTQASGTRKELLPDIEEINSSLRSETERDVQPEPTPEEKQVREKKGFRYGLSLMILLAAILLLIYVFAPRIAEQFPQTAPALEGYVDAVDSGRIWLDEQVQRLLAMVQGDGAES